MDIHTILSQSPAFTGLGSKALGLLAEAAEKRHVRSGDVIFDAGQRAASLHVIGTGRLLLLSQLETLPDGEPRYRRLRELGRGEVVGGVSMMTGERRLTRVEAMRDSVLVSISKHDFERIASRHPSDAIDIALYLIARLLRSVQAAFEPPSSQSLATLALVPGHPGMDLSAAADGLGRAMGEQGSTLRLSADRVDQALGEGAAQCPWDDTARSEQVASWLGELETQYRHLIYASDGRDSPWARRCVRQADRVLVVVDGAARARDTAELRAFRAMDSRAPTELLVSHYTGERRRADPAAWCAHAGCETVLHATVDDPDSMARTVRLLTGRGLGLVLGGGGARGFAHLGLWRAVEKLGIDLDVLGGASMGAYIAALMAIGMDVDAGIENVRETFVEHNYLNDFVVPRVGLISGRKFQRRLHEVFGDRKIEDLSVPYYCVSTNLSKGEAVSHQSGGLQHWLAASMAVPGIAPPLVWQGDLLADGGVLDSLPTSTMRALGRGPFISCDVSNREQFAVPDNDSGHPMPLRWQRGVDRFPNIFRLLHRAATVVSAETIAQREHDADCYLHMPVSGVGMFDWEHIDRIITESYDYAMPRLEAFLETQSGAMTQTDAAGRRGGKIAP